MTDVNRGQATWVDALAVEDLPRNDVLGLTVAGRDIAICTVGDAIHACDDLCTHGQARLSDGWLDGHALECPLHQGQFDVRSGAPLRPPVTEALRCWPVKVEGGRVFLQLD